MKTFLIILISVFVTSAWSTAWLVAYTSSKKEPDWMFCLAGGPVLWLWFCGVNIAKIAVRQYYRYFYKAIVTAENGNKYCCESNVIDEICEQYELTPAFEFIKTAEYKPYKPKLYKDFYQKNPRYVHRNVACKFPKLFCVEER